MKNKKIFIISISLLVICVTVIITHIISIHYYKSYWRFHEDAKRVRELPDPAEWYIHLNEIVTSDGNMKWYVSRSRSEFVFVDSDNLVIYSAALNDSQVIVKYKGEYYVHKFVYEDALYEANIVAEQRNRIYSLGDAVILRGRGVIPFVVIINSVETESVGNVLMSTISFTTNPKSIPDYQSWTGRVRNAKIFDHIETDKGTIIDEFILVDEGIVKIEIPLGEKINMIVVKSPDYEDCIRKVNIKE